MLRREVCLPWSEAAPPGGDFTGGVRAITQYRKVGERKQPWPKLRRFRPITKLPGKRRAYVALALVVIGYFVPLVVQVAGGSDVSGIVVGGLVCAVGAIVGWRARDSRGRGIAWTAVVIGTAFTFAYLVAFRAIRM